MADIRALKQRVADALSELVTAIDDDGGCAFDPRFTRRYPFDESLDIIMGKVFAWCEEPITITITPDNVIWSDQKEQVS